VTKDFPDERMNTLANAKPEGVALRKLRVASVTGHGVINGPLSSITRRLQHPKRSVARRSNQFCDMKDIVSPGDCVGPAGI